MYRIMELDKLPVDRYVFLGEGSFTDREEFCLIESLVSGDIFVVKSPPVILRGMIQIRDTGPGMKECYISLENVQNQVIIIFSSKERKILRIKETAIYVFNFKEGWKISFVDGKEYEN